MLTLLLLFQVAYQRILQLTYVDDLLNALKALFLKQFGPFLTTFVASLNAIAPKEVVSWDFSKALEGWDAIFDTLLAKLEEKAAQVSFKVCGRFR